MSEVSVQIDPKIVERVTKLVGSEPLTMYRLANVWSDLVGYRVREQQAYNYRKHGMIKCNEAGRCLPDDAIAFLLKKLSK